MSPLYKQMPLSPHTKVQAVSQDTVIPGELNLTVCPCNWGLMKALLFLSLIITSLLTCIGRPDSTSLLQHCAKRFLSFEVYKIPGMVIAKHLLKQWKYNFNLGLSFTRITKKKKPNKQFLHNYFRPMGIDSLKKNNFVASMVWFQVESLK